MKLIELHILQSFPVSCLNRDDVGAPKSAVFGGAMRSRISSQCLKRAARRAAQDEYQAAFQGSRTRKAAEELAAELVKRAWTETDARKTAEAVLNLFLSDKEKKPKKNKKASEDNDEEGSSTTSTLLYFSPSEISLLADGIVAGKENNPDADMGKLKDAAIKALGKGLPKDAVDIAIFGRMVAAAPDVTLEGAGMFSHALSTHKSDNDLDFWTAVDDEKTLGDDAGAANMGIAEFNSSCFYRYAALNLDLLFDQQHLAVLDGEERKKVVDAFIRATLLAMPSARQNSMNAHVPPLYVIGIYKDKGQPMQLVNAFEKPVWSKDGLVEKSIEAMKQHHETMKKTWGIRIVEEVSIPDVDIDTFCETLVRHV